MAGEPLQWFWIMHPEAGRLFGSLSGLGFRVARVLGVRGLLPSKGKQCFKKYPFEGHDLGSNPEIGASQN